MTLDYQQLSWVWYIDDNLHGYMHYLLLVKRLELNYAPVRGAMPPPRYWSMDQQQALLKPW